MGICRNKGYPKDGLINERNEFVILEEGKTAGAEL